jgi:CRP-like cAMP-binding protein
VPPSSELPIPNLFLASLAQDDFEALQPHFESVRLPLRQILHEMRGPIEHCYFMDEGMTSLVIRLEDGASIEAGVVGKEGFAGAAALMGFENAAPHMSMIQMPGMGVRILSKVLKTEMLRRPILLDRVHRFTQMLNVQISHTAACNAHHNLSERLARWLLMAHDRAESDALPLTQEFLSMMLAVRRPGVTVAARSLLAIGAIDYRHGSIAVLDRACLEEASCECYGHCPGALSPYIGVAPAAQQKKRILVSKSDVSVRKRTD